MRRVLAIRHIHFEDLGIWAPVFQAAGFRIDYREAADTDFAALDPLADDVVVILGAPIGAHDEARHPFLNQELAFIRQRLLAERPLLGICLGAQLLARLLGARVEPMSSKEIGYAPLQLTDAGHRSPLRHLDGVPVLHWHGDQFDIPDGCDHLAASSHCPHQAFSRGQWLLAVQCHPEADPQRLEHWLLGHACEWTQAGIDPHVLRRDAAAAGTQSVAAATAVLETWLAGLAT